MHSLILKLLCFLITVLIYCSFQQPALATADPDVWQQQVIYLVFPDRFQNGNVTNDNWGSSDCFAPSSPTKFHGGDWAGLRQRIDYLKELGVTAVWATPVYKQVGLVNGNSCGYHGYWADLTDPDDAATEPKLGDNDELKSLIEDLHDDTNNIKFIMDQVVNHAGYGARITQQHPDWFNPPRPDCEQLGDPEVFCDLAGLPDFNFRNSEAVDYITQESLGWVERFPLDGVRMDTVKHVPVEYFKDTWVPKVNQVSPDIFLVGEFLDKDNLAKLKPFIDAGFDSVFNFPLQKAMVDTFAQGQSVDLVAKRVQETLTTFGMDRTLLLTNLVDNHDIPRFINEPGFGVPEDEIRRRYHLALGSLFTLPGIPQLYYGDEIGMYGGSDPDNRRDMPSWAWTSTGRNGGGSGFLPQPQTTFSYVQKLISVRQSNPALHSGYYAEMWRQNDRQNPDVYAFFRGKEDNRIIVVMNNGTFPSGSISIPIQANTSIKQVDRDALKDGTVLEELLQTNAPSKLTITDSSLNINLPAKTIGIYKLSNSQ